MSVEVTGVGKDDIGLEQARVASAAQEQVLGPEPTARSRRELAMQINLEQRLRPAERHLPPARLFALDGEASRTQGDPGFSEAPGRDQQIDGRERAEGPLAAH